MRGRPGRRAPIGRRVEWVLALAQQLCGVVQHAQCQPYPVDQWVVAQWVVLDLLDTTHYRGAMPPDGLELAGVGKWLGKRRTYSL